MLEFLWCAIVGHNFEFDKERDKIVCKRCKYEEDAHPKIHTKPSTRLQELFEWDED